MTCFVVGDKKRNTIFPFDTNHNIKKSQMIDRTVMSKNREGQPFFSWRQKDCSDDADGDARISLGNLFLRHHRVYHHLKRYLWILCLVWVSLRLSWLPPPIVSKQMMTPWLVRTTRRMTHFNCESLVSVETSAHLLSIEHTKINMNQISNQTPLLLDERVVGFTCLC